MNKLSLALLVLIISAAGSVAIATFLGRALMLSSRAEVVRLGGILFFVAFSILLTLILAVRRRG